MSDSFEGLEQLRATLLEQFCDFLGGTHNNNGPASGEPMQMNETLLLKDGHYCGRRFTCQGLSAVWRADTSEVTFFAQDGTPLTAENAPRARAA